MGKIISLSQEITVIHRVKLFPNGLNDLGENSKIGLLWALSDQLRI